MSQQTRPAFADEDRSGIRHGAVAGVDSDGVTRTYVLRDSTAPGIRIQFEDFVLPDGVAAYVQNADGTESYGPFTAAGPNQDSQFLSPIVHGNTVRVVLQADGDLPAGTPFRVKRVIAVDADEVARFDAAAPAKLGDDGEVRTSLYKGVPITHSTVGGLAIHEGDILIGETRNLQAIDEPSKGMERRSFGILSYPTELWPGGVIPYVVDGTVVTPSTVTDAVNSWNSSFSGNTKLVPRTNQTNYVYFTRNSTPNTCASYVGMMGGAQPIYVGDYCTSGNLVHEIGHAYGLLHEHTRIDRNTYVTINYGNINTSYTSNFDIATYATDMGAYDYSSIMHYPSTAFSTNGLPTITTIPAGISIGQRTALSAGDIAGVNKLYPPATSLASTTANLSVATSPYGLKVQIDGATYASTKTLAGVVGSSHTISAPSPQYNGTSRYIFANWSNGKAQTFTLSMPTADTTVTANYQIEYQVNASATAGGTATVSPTDSDGYYPRGAMVTLTATPTTGYCFSSWTTGLTAGTPPTTSFGLWKSYSATANFAVAGAAAYISQTSGTYSSAASSGYVTIGSTTACQWTATSSASWLKFSNGSTIFRGNTGMTLNFTLAANTTGLTRTATIKLGADAYTVTQLP